MQKTKLGISVGLLGAALYFATFFGGYLVAIILAGYILLVEDNVWLRKNAVKAVALTMGFSLIAAVINLIPNAIGFIDSVVTIFGGDFYLTIVSNILNVINNALSITEKVLFILLGLKAFNQGTIRIPVIDSIVDKYVSQD